ncbi:MAG: hypothetical protein WBV40_07610 [Candidatus Cybelea sp.]|jgi:hypothetical protein
MENDSGLKRALEPGDEVILSTGATATVRGSYPQGYTGNVAILLGDAEETERASGLTLPDNPPIEIGPELGDVTAAQQTEIAEIRAPSRRMED